MGKTVGVMGATALSERGVPSQRAAESYCLAVAAAGAVPLIVPGLPQTQDIGHLVGVLDGIVLTGGRANVHPSRYDAEPTPAYEPYDRGRDAVALALVEAAVEHGIPLLGICRGLQEMNVAFGGTLHPEIRDLPGRMNHRMPTDTDDRAVIMAPRHDVHLTPGGVFAGIFGSEVVRVNSLHGQGIETAGPRVIVEGRAEDTTPEAIRIDGAAGFALGVQWHAEHAPDSDPVNSRLWQAFGRAVGAS